jgi:hypothetical protein
MSAADVSASGARISCDAPRSARRRASKEKPRNSTPSIKRQKDFGSATTLDGGHGENRTESVNEKRTVNTSKQTGRGFQGEQPSIKRNGEGSGNK